MSLSRSFFNEFRPLFRLFDEVSRTHPSYAVRAANGHRGRLWDDFDFPHARRPTVDLSEQGNDYVVEAELPGVKKENLDVRVGDQGRSLTIEGRVLERTHPATQGDAASEPANNGNAGAAQGSLGADVQSSDASTQITSEREYSSHFTRTVWLPRTVDGSKVTGSLTDGILTLRIPKASDPGSVKVEVQ